MKLERVHGNGPELIDIYTGGNGYENKVDIAFGPGSFGMSNYVIDHPNSYQIGRSSNSIVIEIMEFNYSLPAVRNINFRKAVSYAIDRDARPPENGDLKPAYQLISEMSYGYQRMQNNFNLEKAKHYFNMLPKSFRNATYKLVCHGPTGTEVASYYTYLRDSLVKIGMKVELSLDEIVAFDDSKKDAAMLVWGRLFEADPLIAFSEYLPKKSFRKAPDKDPEYVYLFNKAEDADSIFTKAEFIKLMSKHIEENAIILPLHERFDPYFYSKRIKKVVTTEITGYLDLSKIEVYDAK